MNPVLPIVSLVMAGHLYLAAPLNMSVQTETTKLHVYRYKEKEYNRHPENPPKRHLPIVRRTCFILPDGEIIIEGMQDAEILLYEILTPEGELLGSYTSKEDFIADLSSLTGEYLLCFTISEAEPDPVLVRQELSDAMPPQYETAARMFTALAADCGPADNMLFSPWAFSSVMGMTANAAEGTTREEILKLLGADDLRSLNRTNALLNRYMASLEGDAGPEAANGIWSDRNIGILTDFTETLMECYGYAPHTVDYSSGEAADIIGSWVNTRTGGTLPAAPAIDGTSLAGPATLVNAVGFNGSWDASFPSDRTRMGTFTSTEHLWLTDYMNGWISTAKFADLGDSQVVTLPFEGSEYQLMLVLPDPNTGISDFISTLTGERLQLIATSGEPTRVYVTVPKFTIGSTEDLSGTLAGLGCSEIFTPAQWTGMTGDYVPVNVDRVIHTVSFGITETGTPGAPPAPTDTGDIDPPSEKAVFTADRPFLFMLTERECGIPIFIGLVQYPDGPGNVQE